MTESNLLAYLAIYCKVDYISDLSLTPKCKEIIHTMDERMFRDVNEWNEAVRYLTKNNHISFQSVASAKEYLINYKI